MLLVGYLTSGRLNGIGRAQRKSRASDKLSALPSDGSAAFHMLSTCMSILGPPTAIASWGCRGLQDNFFHLIFTGRIVNILPTSAKLDIILRLLKRKEAFPKASRLLLLWCSCRWL